MTLTDYVVFVGFITVMALAGLMISRLIRSSDDFFVAGRELTPFVLCATITASNVSMFHFVGMGGTAYQSGVSIGWQNWSGNMALVLSGMFVIPLMRRLKIRSIPEFLEMRYSPVLRVLIGAFWGLKLCMYLGILLYVAATAAIIATGCDSTLLNYLYWLAALSTVSVLYSTIGGAWAVAIMDSVQFVVMMGAALIILPIATHAAGGFPSVMQYLRQHGQENHLALIPTTGEFNWMFIAAMTLLSLKWATVDQAILQRAFGARSPRAGAQGMVLSAIVTTPLALFWILPGLATQKLNPNLSAADHAIPWLLANTIPRVGRGLLGIVLCGLIAAQISTITSDVNSVATLFTSDIYRRFRAQLSQRETLIVVRISSLLCGAIMLTVAYFLFPGKGGAVRANLTLVGILDMPLFVITIIYGLTWRRINWQGAVAGFIAGGTLGILTHALINSSLYDNHFGPLVAHCSTALASFTDRWHAALVPHEQAVRNIVPLVSSLTALLVTPIVSLLTQPHARQTQTIWRAFSAAADDASDDFHFVPISWTGRAGMAVVIAGFATYVVGVLCGSMHSALAAPLAVSGLLAVLGGGLVRVYAK